MSELLDGFALRERIPADAPGAPAPDTGLDAAQLQRTGLRAGMDALDVGCGTGSVARVMTTIVGSGRVVGVDHSAARLTVARALAAERGLELQFLAGAATDLPLPAASFDYVWSRFVFADLPQPEQALAELVRVTRPGGTVVVGDLDGQMAQFYPLSPPLRIELEAVVPLLGGGPFDPWVGRKLYSWFYRAGLREIVVQALPYQGYAGGVPAQALENWRGQLEVGAQRLAQQTGDGARWEQFPERLLTEFQRPDLFYYCTLILVRGTAPS